MFAGGVEVHAYAVHAAFHRAVEAFFQLMLVYIVLVLAHADAFGVYFDEFGQGVHEPAANADGTPHGEVFIGKLFPRRFGGRVNRGTGFIDLK